MKLNQTKIDPTINLNKHLLVIEAIKRQASRKKIMEQYCQTNSYEKEPRVSRENLGYIIVNDEYKFMYCTIPKVGTTTWKRVFAELGGLRQKVKVAQTRKPTIRPQVFMFSWFYRSPILMALCKGTTCKRHQFKMYTLCLIKE